MMNKFVFSKNKVFYSILVLTFLIYGNTLKNQYAFDDDYVTVTNPQRPNNPRIEKGLSGIPEIFQTHYVELKDQSFEYRPLVLTTFAIEYEFFKSNPLISHLINVLIYAFSCYLLYLLLTKIFIGYSSWFHLLIVTTFIAHPIHTEVVANIKCRDELLGFFFGLLATLLLFRFNDTKQWHYLIFSITALVAGILCKKTTELFIFFAPFTLYFFSKAKLKHLFLYFLALYTSLEIFNLIESNLVQHETVSRDYVFFENPLFYKSGFLERLPIAMYSLGYYLKLLLLPFPLSCYYGFNVIPDVQWNNSVVWISMLIYLSLLLYAIYGFRKKTVASYCILVFLLGIYPFSNLFFTPTGIIADRYIYFASMPFCIAIVDLLLKAFNLEPANSHKNLHIKSSFFYCFILLTAMYSITVVSRNNKWKDEITLLRNDLKHFPESCNLNYIAGNKLYSQIMNSPDGIKNEAMIQEAKKYYTQALRLMEQGIERYPQDFTTLNNIGTIYVNIFNDPYRAQPYFKKSLTANAVNKQTLYNDAFCYEKKARKDSARIAYEKLIRLDSNYYDAYTRLKPLYMAENDFKKAIICDKKAIEKNPTNAKLFIDLGNTLINNKDTSEAITQFVRAVKLEPNNTTLKNQIVTFLTVSGNTDRLGELQ